ncbi:tetratricopeptide repeat protein [Pleionea sediminis]|uniref:tetratricopeptide repeat protein n=1 Tax=Pleionea sediminis TaxID=2569479 RepID=UPI001184AE3E|nr:tetratricopeptide repeat protein [Pleionea sediminis]
MKFKTGFLILSFGIGLGILVDRWIGLDTDEAITSTVKVQSDYLPQQKQKKHDNYDNEALILESYETPEESQLVDTGTRCVNDSELPSVISRLLNIRSILPKDLRVMKLWLDFEEFSLFISNLELSDYQQHALLAKANSYYFEDFVLALEELYIAKRYINNESEGKVVNGQIQQLTDHIINRYFSEDSLVEQKEFVDAMYFLLEKNPGDIHVNGALIRHHLMMKDFDIVESFIDTIPESESNSTLIDSYRARLSSTRLASSGEKEKGIPLIKVDNKYAVNVNFSDDAEFLMILDRESSNTIIPGRFRYFLNRASPEFYDMRLYATREVEEGRLRFNIYRTDFLKLGKFLYNNPIILSDEHMFRRQKYGVLGKDVLSAFDYKIDTSKGRLYLSY